MSATLIAIKATSTKLISSNGLIAFAGSGRLALEADAADGERDFDVAARGP